MITNELRREVARKLRSEAELWRKSYPETEIDLSETEVVFQDVAHFLGIHGKTCPEMLYNRLADLIDRPMCKPKDRGRGYVDAVCDSFCCPNCGFEIDVHIGEEQHLTETAKYCPNCGAEVQE